jgi:3-hydroxy acid dehydrogenase/malonic semialdehyde reductase
VLANKNFAGKTVWVTGASAGIGEAAARAFASLGAKVVLIARRVDRLIQIVGELTPLYPNKAIYLALDVTIGGEVEKGLKSLPEDFSTPDILVNNAGLARGLKTADDTTYEEANAVIDTNIKGVIHFTKFVLPIMKQRNSGHIFTLGSVAAIKPYAKGAVYCGSKAFIEAYNLSLREELVETRIRLSLISPGMVGGTQFSNVRLGSDEAAANVYQGITPLSPTDISDQIIFAASRPPHVNIALIECYPVHQASSTTLFRGDQI